MAKSEICKAIFEIKKHYKIASKNSAECLPKKPAQTPLAKVILEKIQAKHSVNNDMPSQKEATISCEKTR